jgi:3-dehydroquinate synthetase
MRGLCEEEDLHRLRFLLQRIGLPTTSPVEIKNILQSIAYDKKIKNNMIYFVLTKGVGHVTVAPISDRRELRRALVFAGRCS